jgi:hypothetical protein
VSRPPAAFFLQALSALRPALDELQVPWLVIGGIAVIARGVPRFTADVDVTFDLGDRPLERVMDALAGHTIRPRIEGAIDFARPHPGLAAVRA